MLEFIGAVIVGIIAICILAKLIALPFRILWKLISNSIVGAVILWILSLIGVPVQIHFLSALIAGLFGLPGVIAVVIYYL